MKSIRLRPDYFQNDHDLKNDQLKILVAELQKERNKALEANCRLRKANIEIAEKNKYISTINTKLEAMVAERTSDVHDLNRKIVRFAEYNAHRIRGPLARIIGLVQIMNLDFVNQKGLDREELEFCLQGLQKSATELDEMVGAVTKLLNENGVATKEGNISGRLLRSASLFLGSAWIEKIERITNIMIR